MHALSAEIRILEIISEIVVWVVVAWVYMVGGFVLQRRFYFFSECKRFCIVQEYVSAPVLVSSFWGQIDVIDDKKMIIRRDFCLLIFYIFCEEFLLFYYKEIQVCFLIK